MIERKPTLFIWIPKTAGTSIVSTYKNMRVVLDQKFDNKGDVTFGHYDVKQLIRAGIISKEYWQQAYKFTVVRNPYDRFISLYHDFKRTGRIASKLTEVEFAHTLLQVTRKPGLYNTLDFSQCASQVDWLLPGVEIKRFDAIDIKAHLNKSSGKSHYTSELTGIVNELYRDDFILLNYEMR